MVERCTCTVPGLLLFSGLVIHELVSHGGQAWDPGANHLLLASWPRRHGHGQDDQQEVHHGGPVNVLRAIRGYQQADPKDEP